jgi:ELMO/CED-12 family
MVKRLQRAVTGQTAVERICGGEYKASSTGSDGIPCMAVAFWNEWSTSKQLARIFAEHGSRANMNVTLAASAILGVKKQQAAEDPAARGSDVLRENLTRCLIAIRDLNALKAAVEALRAQHYSAENPAHEKLLNRLWTTLMPGKERQGGRISRDWGVIGFQQRDPASDFRGGGMLGLEQLVHMASTRTNAARRMLTEPASESSRYPWACVGINVTMEALSLLRSSRADAPLLTLAHAAAFGPRASQRVNDPPDVASMLAAYHNLYADMFETFHCRWVAAKPENVLAFKPIFEKSMDAVRRDLERDGRVRIAHGSTSLDRQKAD